MKRLEVTDQMDSGESLGELLLESACLSALGTYVYLFHIACSNCEIDPEFRLFSLLAMISVPLYVPFPSLMSVRNSRNPLIRHDPM